MSKPRRYCIDLGDGRVACIHLVRTKDGRWIAEMEVRRGSHIIGRTRRTVPCAATDDEPAFVARVSYAKDKRGRKRYRLNIPAEISDHLSLSSGEYVVVRMRRGKWYHLIKWTERDLEDPGLSEEIKREVRQLMSRSGGT